MPGPRKSTIEKKLKSVLEVLNNSRYQDAVKLKKVTEKVTSLTESLAGSSSASKRKPSAYQMFVKVEIAKLKKSNPDMKQTDLITQAAKSWKAKNPETKKPVAPKDAKKTSAKKTKKA